MPFTSFIEALSSYLKANFTQNFNKPEYLFLKPIVDSLKSKYFIYEDTEVQKDGWTRNKPKFSNLGSVQTCTLLTAGEGYLPIACNNKTKDHKKQT